MFVCVFRLAVNRMGNSQPLKSSKWSLVRADFGILIYWVRKWCTAHNPSVSTEDDFSVIQQEIVMVKSCKHRNIVAYHGSYIRWDTKPHCKFVHYIYSMWCINCTHFVTNGSTICIFQHLLIYATWIFFDAGLLVF